MEHIGSVLHSVSKMASMSHLETDVRQHLTRVYACLTATSVAAFAGTLIYLAYPIYAANLISFIGTLACLVTIYSLHNDESQIRKRLGFLMGLGFFSGLGCGPLVEYSLHLNPGIVVTAVLCSIFVFASFSVASLFAKRGQYLMLAGPLGTLLTTLFALSIANIFFGIRLIYQVNMYLGLLVMCGFILFDTTLIVEKARIGNKDYIAHSCDLFIDLISVFKRILVILTKREEEEQRNRRRR